MKKWLALSLAANLILLAAVLWPVLNTKYEVCKPGLPDGAKLPSMRVRTANGLPVDIDAKDGLTLIAVWASWCAPCIAEIPGLDQLAKKYGPQGLKVAGLSLDPLDQAAPILMQYKPSYIQLFSSADEARGKLFFGTLPFDILVDRNGRIIHTYLGASSTTLPEIESEIIKNLK